MIGTKINKSIINEIGNDSFDEFVISLMVLLLMLMIKDEVIEIIRNMREMMNGMIEYRIILELMGDEMD